MHLYQILCEIILFTVNKQKKKKKYHQKNCAEKNDDGND